MEYSNEEDFEKVKKVLMVYNSYIKHEGRTLEFIQLQEACDSLSRLLEKANAK